MEEQEEFTRVDAKFMIGCRKLTADQAKAAQSRIGGAAPSGSNIPHPPPVEDPALQEWLNMINSKLDALTASLAQNGPGADDKPPMKSRPVNLSAAMAIFPADGEYARGDVIEIFMTLPAKPNLDLVMLGQVVKFNDPIVTAKFARVSEEIRQKIADYVFLREREILMAERL